MQEHAITEAIFLEVTFLKSHFRPLFLYFRLFNRVDSKQIFHIKVCRRLDLNRGPLVYEVTALPTESQPLPNK